MGGSVQATSSTDVCSPEADSDVGVAHDHTSLAAPGQRPAADRPSCVTSTVYRPGARRGEPFRRPVEPCPRRNSPCCSPSGRTRSGRPAADPSRTPAAHPSDGSAGRPVACSNDRHRAQSPVGNAGGKNDRALARPTVCFRDAADRLADQGPTVGVGASPFRATDRSPLTRGGPELGDRNLTPRHATFQPALDCCVIALGKWFPRRRYS